MSDPLDRLTYLRGKMNGRPVRHPRPLGKRLLVGILIIVGFSFALPTHSVVSDVSAHGHYQRFPSAPGTRVPENFSRVWLVEDHTDYEVYSNGLRIDNSFLVPNQSRFYQVLDRKDDLMPLQEWKSLPVGIVFHTTESSIAPFDIDQNENLKRLAQGLLSHLRESRSYNFVIDRFGRVFRVVDETSAANHAGNSIWADDSYVYLNLNNSFLGVAFEAQTAMGDGGSAINEAQMHAGRVLTEMLRAKYKIATTNCVTHAQVSVNPSNMRIGYHTDWASNFPFAEIGLPDNYDQPLASLSEFGFEYDDVFQKAIGDTLWRGIDTAEKQFVKEAAARKRTLGIHRGAQQERYRRLYSALKLTGAMEEGVDVTSANSSK
jgi:hypothetical protein